MDQRIHEEQLKEAARDGGEPVTLRGRLARRVRRLSRQMRGRVARLRR